MVEQTSQPESCSHGRVDEPTEREAAKTIQGRGEVALECLLPGAQLPWQREPDPEPTLIHGELGCRRAARRRILATSAGPGMVSERERFSDLWRTEQADGRLGWQIPPACLEASAMEGRAGSQKEWR